MNPFKLNDYAEGNSVLLDSEFDAGSEIDSTLQLNGTDASINHNLWYEDEVEVID